MPDFVRKAGIARSLIVAQDVDLTVRIGTKVLRNPIFLAPGPLGRNPLGMKKFADASCGLVSTTEVEEP